MVKVLFVCTGNICRSPTAHAVLRSKAQAAGAAVTVESAGTHAHAGSPPDPRSSAAARLRGYDLSDLRGRQLRHSDFDEYDYILCMDGGHLAALQRLAPHPMAHKVQMFDDRDVGDPYYGSGDGFETVLDQIEAGCDRWLEKFKS